MAAVWVGSYARGPGRLFLVRSPRLRRRPGVRLLPLMRCRWGLKPVAGRLAHPFPLVRHGPGLTSPQGSATGFVQLDVSGRG
ncbi:hypothetical protein SALCHL_004090 [Streptomyces albus subsp. chlorinus]